jgi:alcohol dehydrogenase YqhD (iron-dependent ADH family)
MIDFDFQNPTRIVFGRKAENKIAAMLQEYGLKNVLLVYGGGSIKASGLYGRVVKILDEAGITHHDFGGITPNPDKRFCLSGVKMAREFAVDGVLAIGGGSVIDVAKSIGVGFYYDGDPFDFNLHKSKPTKTLPLGVILTIAAAGSESSNSCVISDEGKNLKSGFNSDLIRPAFAIEDPELTFTVSPYQTACGIADIMMHSLERFFNESGPYQLSDEWALGLCRNVMDAGKAALKDPRDYEARAALMIASSLSHDGLTSIGKKQVFVVHPLEHAVSGLFPRVAHGAGIAVCYLGWAGYLAKKHPSKFAALARRLFDIVGDDEAKVAIMGVEAMRDFYESIGLPTSLEEFKISESDLPDLVSLASGNGTHVIGCCPQSLNEEDIKAIYALCLGNGRISL